MEIHETFTGQGEFGNFQDLRGIECTLHREYLDRSLPYLGKENTISIGHYDSTDHIRLTRRQVADLLPHLKNFVERGRL